MRLLRKILTSRAARFAVALAIAFDFLTPDVGLINAWAQAATAQPPIPLFTGPSDPSQTQSYLNTLVNSINNILVPALVPLPGAVNFSTLVPSLSSYGPAVSVSGAAGTNVALNFVPQGNANIVLFGQSTQANGTASTGLLQIANAASWSPVRGLGTCPGVPPGQGSTAPGLLGPTGTIRGYWAVQDWLSRTYYMPVC